MNTSNIKRYAPKARTAFIAAMTKRAALFGIRESSIPSMGIEPLEQKGDLALVGGRPFPASIIRPRAALVKKVEQMGFAQAMEQAAYSWFNRLCAIRYMELKGYLEHGRCVLSHPDQPSSFQILDDCLDIELEGLDKQRIAELKLDGTKDEELYRELLLAQCHALHQAMPFLFEAVDDALELLLPDNLTKTDSLIRELVSAIPEEDWQDVEIIGWLYQFYISEKKEQVIGTVVKSEDIPAATQLFTPNWIVQYLVQNSVGRQWLQTYPDSPLKAKMPYYIEPAEQTPEVLAQLAVITPDSIDPLSIKVLDPACGSGHILVEAYKVLKEIYTERGFRSRDIPQLILEHNLFGLDIDDRAGQLSGFALLMLAREDDRRIFSRLAENGFRLNVLSLQESSYLDFLGLWQALNLSSDLQRHSIQDMYDSKQTDLSTALADSRFQLLKTTLARFTQAKTFGSLIEVPAEDAQPLSELLEQLRQLAREGDVMQKPTAEQLIPFVQQAWVLAQLYDAVVANPPYMGIKFYNHQLKTFINKNYKEAKGDLYAAFIANNLRLVKCNGYVGMITIPNWMFLSSFEEIRRKVLNEFFIDTFIHNGRGVWGSDFGSCSFVFRRSALKSVSGLYKKLFLKQGSVNSNDELKKRFFTFPQYQATIDSFKVIPGSPIAYWVSNEIRNTFSKNSNIGRQLDVKSGITTGLNEKYILFWHEVEARLIEKGPTNLKISYSLHNKGGDFRKWYGNIDSVLKYGSDHLSEMSKSLGFRHDGKEYFYQEMIGWSKVTSGKSSFRYYPKGFSFNTAGLALFEPNSDKPLRMSLLGLLNSSIAESFIGLINPTLNVSPQVIKSLPFIDTDVESHVIECIHLSKQDWDAYETSLEFKVHPLLKGAHSTLEQSFNFLSLENLEKTFKLKKLEEEINKQFLQSTCLGGELKADVPIEQVTLTGNAHYRYDGNATEAELNSRLQSDTLVELVSYTIGCIMGRYSLDREGLVYALSGNQDFAGLVVEGAYKTFPADSDGILPLTDQEWFSDDATNRFREFVRTIWGDEHLQENLDFVADSLCLYAIKPKRGESALDTIRRYLSTQFYKDHLKTYKKRPIYWLFSSGKHKAFECLVYLHRCNESTLARMRTEYVSKLMAKLAKHAETLEKEVDASTSTAEKKALEKQLDTLHNQQAELATFDEKLRHYADQRISLDLDAGVKVNYAKFGDLLAEVKAVTGDKSSD